MLTVRISISTVGAMGSSGASPFSLLSLHPERVPIDRAVLSSSCRIRNPRSRAPSPFSPSLPPLLLPRRADGGRPRLCSRVVPPVSSFFIETIFLSPLPGDARSLDLLARRPPL